MSIDRAIGTRLKSARKKAGFKSARSFANAHGIPYITYSQHEAGSRRVNPDTIMKYAAMLNCSPGWILTGFDEYNTPVNNENSPTQTTIDQNNLVVNHEIMDTTFLADIFEELNKTLHQVNMKISDKEKITISIELYKALSNTSSSLTSKKNNLKCLMDVIIKLKSKFAA